jgi:DNA polymerase-3 subunit epsilon
LLWNGEDLEVLEPLWLRKEIARKIKRMLNKYINIDLAKRKRRGTPFNSVNRKVISAGLKDFAAIDFETANYERSSICSVGVVIVRNDEIVDSFYSLIRPEPNYYNNICSNLHGLCQQDTDKAPAFPKVWAHIEPLIEGLPLVAHNKVFEEGCLKAVFRAYQMDYPNYEFYDTLIASKQKFPDLPYHQLYTVAAACGYQSENYQNALSYAEACAWIARKIFE